MDGKTDHKPDVKAIGHTSVLLTALELTEIFPCVWVCQEQDGAIFVRPDGRVCICNSLEIALRVAATAWNFHQRPAKCYGELNWPALQVPWLAPVTDLQPLRSMSRQLLRSARLLLRQVTRGKSSRRSDRSTE